VDEDKLLATSLSVIVMPHLDASCTRQEIQCSRYFAWTTQR